MTDKQNEKKLIKKVVDAAEPQPKLYYITDSEISGFRLIIYPSGTKTYVFDYRMGKGRNYPLKRVTIGPTNKFSPDQAREKAKEHLAQVIAGTDPSDLENQKKDRHRFEEIWERYFQEHVMIKNKPSTQKGVKQTGKAVILPYFKGRFIEEITSRDIHAFMLSKRETSPVNANRCRSHLSKMFSLCERPWEIRPLNSNPCRGVFKYPEKRRERYLSDEELVNLVNALDQLLTENLYAYQTTGNERPLHRIRVACYIKLMLFTGARGIEWRDAKVKEVDIERMILQPETTKNDEPAISLPPEAIEIIQFLLELPRPENNPYLFPGKCNVPGRYRQNMAYPKAVWDDVRTKAGLENFRLHDLRHSWAAFALASGLSLADVGQQLNHKTYQTTKRYEHLADAVKRQNVATVGSAISSIGAGKAKVIDIRSQKKG